MPPEKDDAVPAARQRETFEGYWFLRVTRMNLGRYCRQVVSRIQTTRVLISATQISLRESRPLPGGCVPILCRPVNPSYCLLILVQPFDVRPGKEIDIA
jgi:hypothetical protein